ncbi:hypothetical protein D3C71_1888900 [compost metagenome]
MISTVGFKASCFKSELFPAYFFLFSAEDAIDANIEIVDEVYQRQPPNQFLYF